MTSKKVLFTHIEFLILAMTSIIVSKLKVRIYIPDRK